MNKVKDQTYEEKVQMYQTCSKRELIDMLIEANNHIEKIHDFIVDDSTPSEKAIKWAESVIEERIINDA